MLGECGERSSLSKPHPNLELTHLKQFSWNATSLHPEIKNGISQTRDTKQDYCAWIMCVNVPDKTVVCR